MVRRAALVAVALLLAVGVADAQGPVRIGAPLSLTGTYAKLGNYQHEGYKLGQRDLNARVACRAAGTSS